MRRLAWMTGLVVVGYLTARFLFPAGTVAGLDGSPGYLLGTSLLLAVGLYGSTYAIDLDEARRDRRLILLAVTLGVLVKAVLVGGVLALARRDPLFLVLGVAVAQIDPLSVASIMDDRRISPRVRSMLAAWSSFDDPITVVLAVYLAVVVPATRLQTSAALPGGARLAPGVLGYGADLLLNLAVAGAALGTWRLLRPLLRDREPVRERVALVLLAGVAAVAVWQFLMLAVALVGLFLRPRLLGAALPGLVRAALAGATVLLGVLLTGGLDLVNGVLLGLAAFIAQVVVSLPLTRRLPCHDRWYVALAQQNGITAIILALRLEAEFVGVVMVVCPAILVINMLHLVANALLRRASHPSTGGQSGL